MVRQTKIILYIFLILKFVSIINTQSLPLCESLNGIDTFDHDQMNEEIKLRRVRALCDAIYSSQDQTDNEELDTIPDFDFTNIKSDDDANQILKRFRRSRFSSSRSSSSSSSGSSSSGSRSSSSSGSRFFGGSRSSSSSSSGTSRFFGGSSSSSGSGSRIFSRSSGTSSGSSSGSRLFSRHSGSSSGSSTGSRWFGRSSGSSSSSSSSASTGARSGIFSRSSPSSSSGGSGHRIRQAVRSVIRKPAKPSSGLPSGTGGLSGTGGSKPGLSDKIRKITQGGGSGISTFGSGRNRYGSGISGGGFGTGGSSGSGGNAWVRTGKKFLPYAVRFGKRYYQRRKYSKGMYAGIGAGAGYYAGSRMGGHHGHYYPDNYNNYGYPPVVDNEPQEIDGKPPTVFYCIQEDLNTTLVNQTLNDEGFGVCNISGELVTCPIEIECKTSEADTCCEDEQGKPICCGGPIPEEHASVYGGYGDDLYDTAESFDKILNIITATLAILATICFTMWRREE